MTFSPDTYADGLAGKARKLAQALAERADADGEVELTIYELRGLVGGSVKGADREIAAMKAMHRLHMVGRPPQRGLRARWRLSAAHGAITVAKSR